MAFPLSLSMLTASLLAMNLDAQHLTPAAIQRFLPPTAKIIETANLKTGHGSLRTLVLWMIDPKKVIRQGHRGCMDAVYGDHWYGPTRLSLVDVERRALVNTVDIRGQDEGRYKVAGFPVPFYVSNTFYHVPRVDQNKEGVPEIMRLQDLTGEGAQGQFVLFEYQVCGIALTTASGYSSKSDTAIQFPVEIAAAGQKAQVVSWVPHLFREKPLRPGHWDFTWEPGHGANERVRDQVTFDRKRQIFVDRRKITPYPTIVPPKTKGNGK
jgi:hypothetical protein